MSTFTISPNLRIALSAHALQFHNSWKVNQAPLAPLLGALGNQFLLLDEKEERNAFEDTLLSHGTLCDDVTEMAFLTAQFLKEHGDVAGSERDIVQIFTERLTYRVIKEHDGSSMFRQHTVLDPAKALMGAEAVAIKNRIGYFRNKLFGTAKKLDADSASWSRRKSNFINCHFAPLVIRLVELSDDLVDKVRETLAAAKDAGTSQYQERAEKESDTTPDEPEPEPEPEQKPIQTPVVNILSHPSSQNLSHPPMQQHLQQHQQQHQHRPPPPMHPSMSIASVPYPIRMTPQGPVALLHTQHGIIAVPFLPGNYVH